MKINYIKNVENVDEILNEKKYKTTDEFKKTESNIEDDFESILENEKNHLLNQRREIKLKQLRCQKEFYENLKYNKVMKIR